MAAGRGRVEPGVVEWRLDGVKIGMVLEGVTIIGILDRGISKHF